MQPLAYLAARALFGLLQFLERSNRAFLGSTASLVAAGAVHCWAVVYALFVAVHTRAMRYEGYHDGYIEHLPSAVNWTELLAVTSLWILAFTGFATVAIHILDEEAGDLPIGMDDTKVGMFTTFFRSPALHHGLALGHSVSCAGLFISIMLLCVTMAWMSGGITICELSLVIASIGFAMPHAVIAMRHLIGENFPDFLPPNTVEAATAEAAACGPQLCVILALADATDHAYVWQNAVYVCASITFLAAVAACGHNPPKKGGAALPPEPHETLMCLVLDGAAAISIVLSFPDLNTWALWLGGFLFIFLAASIVYVFTLRELFLDVLEPLFVVRSDTYKRLPSPRRQRIRKCAWLISIMCAATALWDIIVRPPFNEANVLHTDSWPFELLVLRWQPELPEHRGAERLLSIAADALGLDSSGLQLEGSLYEHRTMFFTYTGPSYRNMAESKKMNWEAVVASPMGALVEVMDPGFPAQVNISMCTWALEKTEEDTLSFFRNGEARAAYVAACHWGVERYHWKMHASRKDLD